MDTKEKWVQRNSGHRGTVDTEEQWTQRNSEHRGAVDRVGQWARRNRRTVGTGTSRRLLIALQLLDSKNMEPFENDPLNLNVMF